MGQIRKVQVHRLMAKDSVDEYIREILERKTRLFDTYARESAAKDADVRVLRLNLAQRRIRQVPDHRS